MRTTIAILISLAAHPAAGDISLAFPLDCTLDENCYIQQFVDHDPSGAVSDFTCGSLAYDGHKGTDFALSSLDVQATGIDVLAAASGQVKGVRNDMPDILQGSPNAPDASDRECGNGLVLDHGDGFETQYCHMAKGSVTVATGDVVTTGQTLGQVGLSGQTEFPHLHLSVRRNGEVTDPFDPDGEIICDDPSSDTLWAAPPATPPGGIISSGFSDGVPTFDAIKSGLLSPRTLPDDGPALVTWVYMFGSRKGDQVTMTIHGPEGEVISHEETLERTQAQLFRAAGRRTPANGWPPGRYAAVVSMLRGGIVLDSQSLIIDLTP